MLLLLLSLLLLAAGLYLLLTDLLRIPYMKASRAARNLARNQEALTKSLDVWLGDAAQWLSRYVRIGSFRRQALETDLRALGDARTPEQFRAAATVKAAIVGIWAIPLLWISPVTSLICLVMAVWLYRREHRRLTEKLRDKRAGIDAELPRLVGVISKNLKHTRNVIQILQTYVPSAGPELGRELTVTLADMRSGNYELALTRLDGRVGSTLLSSVCRGLINVMNGDSTDVYWESLQLRFSEDQRQRLRREAQKAPERCRWLSLCMLLCMLALFMTVIFIFVGDSLALIFQ